MRTRLIFLRRSWYLPFCVALVVSTYWKLRLLSSRELWLDETYSAFVGSLHFPELLRFVSGDVHPPLFYSLLWMWMRAVGDTPVELRLLGVVLDVLSVLGMFLLAKRVLGLRYGGFAASLFAFSPMLFVYSLEVRSYMLFTFVFICLLYVHWVVVVEEDASLRLLIVYSVLSATLFYIHYLGIFVLLGLLVHRLIHASSSFTRERLRSIGAPALLTLLLISPGISVLLHQHAEKVQLDRELKLSHSDARALSYGVAEQGPGRVQEIRDLAKAGAAVAGFYPANSHIVAGLLAAPLALVLAGVALFWLRKGDEVCQLVGVVVLVCGAGVFVLHLGSTRYLIPLAPLLVLATARVVQVWATEIRWRVAGLAVGGCVLAIYTAGFFRQASMFHEHSWQDLVSEIQQHYQPGDEVVFDALYAQVPFDYYSRHQDFRPRETGFPISNYEWWGKQKFKAWGGPVVLQSDLDRFVASLLASHAKVVWLVLYETSFYDPHDALLERLSQIGRVDEVKLPADPVARAHKADSPLRLVRVALR